MLAAGPNVLALNVVGVISRGRIEQAWTKRKRSAPISTTLSLNRIGKMRDKPAGVIAVPLIAVLIHAGGLVLRLRLSPAALVRQLPRRPLPLLLQRLVRRATAERQPETLENVHWVLSGNSLGAVRSVAISLKMVVMSVSLGSWKNVLGSLAMCAIVQQPVIGRDSLSHPVGSVVPVAAVS